MGLFSSNRRTNINETNIFTDNSNLLVGQGGTGIRGDGNQVNYTLSDSGAIAAGTQLGGQSLAAMLQAVLGALGFGSSTLQTALDSNERVTNAALDLGGQALDINSRLTGRALDFASDSVQTIQDVNRDSLDLADRLNLRSLLFGESAIDAMGRTQRDAFDFADRRAGETSRFADRALGEVSDALTNAAQMSQDATKDALNFAFQISRPQGEATQQRLALAAIAVAGLMVLAVATR